MTTVENSSHQIRAKKKKNTGASLRLASAQKNKTKQDVAAWRYTIYALTGSKEDKTLTNRCVMTLIFPKFHSASSLILLEQQSTSAGETLPCFEENTGTVKSTTVETEIRVEYINSGVSALHPRLKAAPLSSLKCDSLSTFIGRGTSKTWL